MERERRGDQGAQRTSARANARPDGREAEATSARPAGRRSSSVRMGHDGRKQSRLDCNSMVACPGARPLAAQHRQQDRPSLLGLERRPARHRCGLCTSRRRSLPGRAAAVQRACRPGRLYPEQWNGPAIEAQRYHHANHQRHPAATAENPGVPVPQWRDPYRDPYRCARSADPHAADGGQAERQRVARDPPSPTRPAVTTSRCPASRCPPRTGSIASPATRLRPTRCGAADTASFGRRPVADDRASRCKRSTMRHSSAWRFCMPAASDCTFFALGPRLHLRRTV